MHYNTNGNPSEYDANMTSEGKLLEILPLIELNNQPFMLPPTVYHVPNWLLGYFDWHAIGNVQTVYVPAKVAIQGSLSGTFCILSLVIRIIEASPSMNVHAADISLEAVQAIVDAIRPANRSDV